MCPGLQSAYLSGEASFGRRTLTRWAYLSLQSAVSGLIVLVTLWSDDESPQRSPLAAGVSFREGRIMQHGRLSTKPPRIGSLQQRTLLRRDDRIDLPVNLISRLA